MQEHFLNSYVIDLPFVMPLSKQTTIRDHPPTGPGTRTGRISRLTSSPAFGQMPYNEAAVHTTRLLHIVCTIYVVDKASAARAAPAYKHKSLNTCPVSNVFHFVDLSRGHCNIRQSGDDQLNFWGAFNSFR